MDFAAHALHVAMQEQMAQEIKNREYQSLLYSTSGDRFPSGPNDFRAKQHFPQDFRFRNALRRKGKSLDRKVTLPPSRPSSASRVSMPEELRSTALRLDSLRPRSPSPRPMGVPSPRRRAAYRRKDAPTASPCPGTGTAAAPGTSPTPAVLRCRLLGHAESAAVAVPGWQATFESELRGYLAQLLVDKGPGQLHVRARLRNHRVSVHVSMAALEKDAQILQQSLWDGSLRRLALRNRTGLESPWPTSQALRQFLLREISVETFWVVERHEWRIDNFQQALNQRPYAMMTSNSFDLGGGTNLTLDFHPAGGPPGPSLTARGASLTLSAPGHGLPSFPFILSAGEHGEIWAGPYGRDASNRFLRGGALCTVDELRKLHENCLVLAVEAVQTDAPVWAREVRGSDAKVQATEAAPSPSAPPSAPPERDETGEEVDSEQLLRAVTEAAQGVQMMATTWSCKPWSELLDLVAATQQQLQDLALQMAVLQRAVEAKVSPSKSRDGPRGPRGFRHKIDAALELAEEQLLWKVSLRDEEDGAASELHKGTLAGTASGSTLDFQEEPPPAPA